MKPLVIYHDHCQDGFGAAYAAWLAFGDNAEYLPMSYTPTLTMPDTDKREVYVLDFSFKKTEMIKLFNGAERAGWLDHHQTSFEVWCDGGPMDGERKYYHSTVGPHQIILDNDKSGAVLAWEYFHPDKPVPLLIRHIDDRDRWQFKMPFTKQVCANLAAMQPWTFEQWHSLAKRLEKQAKPYVDFIAEGAAILRATDAQVLSAARRAKPCTVWHPGVGRVSGLAINSSVHQSEIGHVLAKQCGTFGLIWRYENGVANISLRSVGDFDVSALARAFGGGGHQHAAGCQVNLDQLIGWLG